MEMGFYDTNIPQIIGSIFHVFPHAHRAAGHNTPQINTSCKFSSFLNNTQFEIALMAGYKFYYGSVWLSVWGCEFPNSDTQLDSLFEVR